MFRWIRRLIWGFNPYYCACKHHKCYHSDGPYSTPCNAGFCSCGKFIPETTIPNMKNVKRAIEQGAKIRV
jgi:hypothetical protein